ncbi:MAG: TatD family hydrolase [Caldicoprobacterales bacterium]|jgi:TatD DNase family protein|nr:TatD family hydrolase [Clostridiales bacterium]
MFFDTHAHLDDERFDSDRQALIEGLPERGISYVVNVGADMDSSRRSVELAEQYPFIYAAVGVHPHTAEEIEDSDLDVLLEMAQHPKVVAIGEIGLDYYYDNSPRDIQRKRFIDQLELSIKAALPVVIHSRDAYKDTMDILTEYKSRLKGCVLHCYSGSWEMAETYLKMGFFISLGGPVTFKNAARPVQVAQNIDLSRLLLETDCPYLAPHPFRGQRNDPGLISLTAEKIARLRGMETEKLAEITLKNACKFFKV